jgi:ADP-heptose:LPS heptosyltransferase
MRRICSNQLDPNWLFRLSDHQGWDSCASTADTDKPTGKPSHSAQSTRVASPMPRQWPSSVSDYVFPHWWSASPRLAPLRWALAAIFHTSYALGMASREVWTRLRQLVLIARNLPNRQFDRSLLTLDEADAPPPAVLVIRTDGIANGILFEPALETLAQSLSPAELHLWAPRQSCEVLRACPALHRRLSLPPGNKHGNSTLFWSPIWRARLGWRLGFHVFNKVIHPADSPEPLGNWLSDSARATERWINAGDTQNQFEWQREKSHARATMLLESRPGNGHELQRNAYLANQWSGTLRLRRPRLHLDARAANRAHRQVESLRKNAALHGAKALAALLPAGSIPLDHYPPESWANAARDLWSRHRVICALLGTPADQQTIATISAILGGTPHLRADRTADVLALAAILGQSDVVLTMDTGLAHTAIAQDVPTIVLRLGAHPGRFFPWPAPSRSLTLFHSMSCEACNNNCVHAQPHCITDLAPAEIVAAYERLCLTKPQIHSEPHPMTVAV